ncbi:hypothetical protein J7T55_005201 [Diaporthe amygdali]|uniref:uncharacterized protein n=1 Tax=Phomopsis amygdali TaxID=1214568 RepID=UPI0022FDCB61|nr:uncharacterized protein J7T55_005201 [Diaporthe amygdali]KAJ0116255.1 hypothetical protein J7T55_005201 [Diaporthe amygdali]
MREMAEVAFERHEPISPTGRMAPVYHSTAGTLLCVRENSPDPANTERNPPRGATASHRASGTALLLRVPRCSGSLHTICEEAIGSNR